MLAIFIVFAIVGSFLGLTFYLEYKTYKLQIQVNCTKGHKWEHVPLFPGADVEYLKCSVCKKSLTEVLEG